MQIDGEITGNQVRGTPAIFPEITVKDPAGKQSLRRHSRADDEVPLRQGCRNGGGLPICQIRNCCPANEIP